ncbi:sterol desaturase family protein [Ralstonia solanacearum]|uniref:sterol desaturase family protein n=1 Tax=Ralstonia solanacearum TaxID=305 RepID=UPI00078E84FA|nr:sterol desaturase family protein [Ralstonia solanacearum]AMP39679.1 fatty acid hydroxylase [Ralstonia solanacearum]AXV88523.1 fatty acid hydroxylase [Ralstonia solanacearum]AXW07998.1 fatty acid hydroxylase [Ralstonia solanacearum]AXW25789.1 fatty acid hydroxylase [Ralstonia solanacearum]AXW63962.1 fatty acid hydroxylase [Ralstonia solanacearum]
MTQPQHSATPPEQEPPPALIRVADATVRDANQLLNSSGGLVFGNGLIATILALVLGFLCLLGVMAFHFPQYLTTPELRHAYSVDVMRQILFFSLLVSGGLALANIVLDNRRRLNGLAFAFVLAAVALGGSRVQVGDFPDHTPYIGLDWFILDLLGSTVIFVLLEKLFPLYKKQPVFRPEWQTDMVHFAVNHFIVGLVLLVVNFLIHRVFGWMVHAGFQQMVQHIWFVPQLLLCMLVADLMEYVTHRAYHEVPFLWRFHAVHHSVKTMDWLAGSRQHILELIVTRVAVLGPLFVLGFDKSVVDTYIIIVGFQAVFNHANVHLPWGPLKYIFVTPDFHHWHHSSEDEAIDKNYAAHFSFIDYLFGTAVKSKKAFPEQYGVVGDYMPDGFINQQRFPFRRNPTNPATPT